MIDQETIRKLTSLRLPGMAGIIVRYIDNPSIIPDTQMDLINAMVDAEEHDRKQRRQERMMKNARLKYRSACLEDFDFTIDRGVNKQLVSWITSCVWIERFQNLIITGATGSGKTYTACAAANCAIRQGHSVLYERFPRLLEKLEIAHGDGSLPSLRAKMQKFKILVLDEWAVSPITARGRLDLLEIIEDRAGIGSLIITTQMPIDQWHNFIGEPTIADAILDRILHRSHKIDLKGESMRKLKESIQEESYV